jgi:hypothetical protein
MTRDLTGDLAPEQYTIQLSGVNGDSASVSIYDPKNNSNISFTKVASSSTMLRLTLMATDYPYLLMIADGRKSGKGVGNP